MNNLLFKLCVMHFALCISLNTNAQDIYNEVCALQKQFQAVAADTTINIDKRRIACFKSDALYYMTERAANTEGFTEYQLGEQANAMIEYVNLFVKKISALRRPSDQKALKEKYKNITLAHSLFNDMEKEIIHGYVDNDDFLTQFSLDTNWMEALLEASR